MTGRRRKSSTYQSRADRPGVWFVIVVVLTGVTMAIAVEGLYRPWRVDGSKAKAAYALAVWLGGAAVAAFIVSGAYSLRRRAMQERWRGSLRAWLHSHVAIGTIFGVAVGMHIGSVPVAWSVWTAGTLALIGSTALIVSGVIWRIAYGTVPPQVARRVGTLSPADLARDIERVHSQIEMLAAGRDGPFLDKVQSIVAGRPIGSTGNSARIDLSDAAALVQIRLLREELAALHARERQQRSLRRALQGWRLAHVPIAFATTVAIGWHVVSVTRLAARTSSPTLDRVTDFPASADCGRCHQTIHDQWLAAAHGHTQLKPVVLAQTNMFVAQLAKEGNPLPPSNDTLAVPAMFCNNCHAPIAAQLTGRAELPIDPDFGHAERRHPVLDDGIACVACHAPHEAPQQAQGVADDFFRKLARAGSLDPADLGYVGRMYAGKPRGDVSVPYHDSGSGFMTDPVETSRLCGACHSVHLDLDNRPPADDPEEDVVLQRTYTEWAEHNAAQGGPGCTECHMTPLTGLVADVSPFLRPSTPRSYAGHTFHVPIEGAAQLAVGVAVDPSTEDSPRLVANVTVTNVQGGHNFPTGFRFAREFWLEVSASTESGEPVCLAPEPVTGAPSPCASGNVATAGSDLLVCEVEEVLAALAKAGRPATLGGNDYPAIRMAAPQPLSDCDPWLTSFRPHLTDGDPDRDGIFGEVAFQSLRAGIVKDPLRVADQREVRALAPGESRVFRYDFDALSHGGKPVVVKAVLHYRRFPPHFLRALGEPVNYFPSGSSAESEIAKLTITVVDEVLSEAVRVPR